MKKNAAGLENIGNVFPDRISSLSSQWAEGSYMSRFPTETLIKSSQSSSLPATELQLTQYAIRQQPPPPPLPLIHPFTGSLFI